MGVFYCQDLERYFKWFVRIFERYIKKVQLVTWIESWIEPPFMTCNWGNIRKQQVYIRFTLELEWGCPPFPQLNTRISLLTGTSLIWKYSDILEYPGSLKERMNIVSSDAQLGFYFIFKINSVKSPIIELGHS